MVSPVKLNLKNYRENVSGHVPPGEYTLQIIDIQQTVAKSSGNDMLLVYMEITDDAKYSGTTIIDRMALTEKALFKIVGLMRGLGLKTPRAEITIDPSKWVGRKVLATLADYKYNDNVSSQVSGYARYLTAEPAKPVTSVLDDEAEDEPLEVAAEPDEVQEMPAETTTTTAAPEPEKAKPVAVDDDLDLDDIDL